MEATGNRPIVLVDQSGNLERRLKTELVSEGYDVIIATTASECVQLVEHNPVISVVSEYELPDLDAINLLRSIRISHPAIPFVLVPAAGSESIAGDAIAAGVSSYIPQTDDTATILSRIRENLGEESSVFDEESHRRYQHLLTIAPTPINIFDEHGDAIWGNDAVLDLLGLEDRSDLIGRSIFDFIHPDDRSTARKELEAVIDEKDSVGPTSMKLLRSDDQLRHIQVSTAVGSYLGADIGQAIILDETERAELYRQLAALSTWLRHNIRNEMNVVSGIAGEISRANVEDTAESAATIQTHVSHLVKQADRNRQMVDLLVNPPEPVSIDITETITDQVQTVQSKYPHTEIKSVRDADVDIKATEQFPQAIGELIENAVRHNNTETPHVWIELDHSEESMTEIHICDDGPGIPADEREILRLEQPISQLNHGSGLGLLFVYTVVTQSGGVLRFEENDPHGSLVKVSVPTVFDDQ